MTTQQPAFVRCYCLTDGIFKKSIPIGNDGDFFLHSLCKIQKEC